MIKGGTLVDADFFPEEAVVVDDFFLDLAGEGVGEGNAVVVGGVGFFLAGGVGVHFGDLDVQLDGFVFSHGVEEHAAGLVLAQGHLDR